MHLLDRWAHLLGENRRDYQRTGTHRVPACDGLQEQQYPAGEDHKHRCEQGDPAQPYKACARHGLGLYIYAGEDLPDDEAKAAKKSSKAAGAKEGGSEAAAERLAARSLCQGRCGSTAR